MFLSLHIKFNYPADCTWSVISSHSNLNREYTTLGLFCGKCPIQISHPMSLRHPVLHVKHYFFRLESQSTIYFSRSLLPRVFEKRPTGCISNLPIQPIARGVSFLAKKWHCVKKWHSAWLFRVHVTLSCARDSFVCTWLFRVHVTLSCARDSFVRPNTLPSTPPQTTLHVRFETQISIDNILL